MKTPFRLPLLRLQTFQLLGKIIVDKCSLPNQNLVPNKSWLVLRHITSSGFSCLKWTGSSEREPYEVDLYAVFC